MALQTIRLLGGKVEQLDGFVGRSAGKILLIASSKVLLVTVHGYGDSQRGLQCSRNHAITMSLQGGAMKLAVSIWPERETTTTTVGLGCFQSGGTEVSRRQDLQALSSSPVKDFNCVVQGPAHKSVGRSVSVMPCRGFARFWWVILTWNHQIGAILLLLYVPPTFGSLGLSRYPRCG